VFTRRGKPPVTAVDDVSLTVGPGEVVGLLGPNGAGKTTLIKCALGLIRPTAGSVLISGWDVSTSYGRAVSNAAAVLEGARNIYWRLTPRENVRFFMGLHGLDPGRHAAYVEELLERLGLRQRADEPVLNLSTGMKQKVAVVTALAKQTPLVFLDEPTLGLDVETSLELRAVLRELVRETGRTIVVSSHDMGVVEDIAERVVIIKGGRILADSRVRDLLGLFATRAYRLVLSNGLGAEQASRLGTVARDVAFRTHGRRTEVEFILPSADKLYEVIDAVREAGAVIESITEKEPDLEEAYLRVVRDGEKA